MMSFLAMLAMRAGVVPRLARPVGLAVAVMLLIALLGLGKCAYDRSVIASHDAAIDAQAAKADRKADAAAAETRRADDARISTEEKQLERIRDDTPATPVSDRRRTRLECIRLQQVARKAGRQPPACR